MFKQFRSLLPYLKVYRGRYVAGMLCLVVVDASQLIVPQILKRVVNLVSSGSFAPDEVLRLALALLGVAVCISAGRFFWRYFIHGSSRRIETSLRDSLFSRLMDLSGGFYQKQKIGDLMARATNDMAAIRQATGMGFVTLFDGLFMSTGILAVMFASAPRTSLFTVIPLPLVTLLIVLFGGMVGPRFKRVQEIYSRLSDMAQESLAGIRVLKAFVEEDNFARKFALENDAYRGASLSLVKVFGFFFPFISFIAGLTTVILLLVGGRAVLDNRLSAGDIVAMLAYLEMLIWPMMGAGFTVNTLQRGAASLARVNEILEAEPEIAAPAGAFAGPVRGDLELRALSFSYPDSPRPALRDISLLLPRGSTLGILGRVGSGKSTLLRLLPRLLDPPPGTVFIGGRDLRDRELGALRRSFGFVPQDSFLFSDTVAGNVRFGAPELSEERFRRVVSVSALDRDLEAFPAGWDTMVGERGLTLSGGQKQRVAIARALAVDPEILVLDDALSAVDAETEERILSALLDERRSRTNIIVSHRVSTLRHADLIVVLEEGGIAQRGSHEELLAGRDGFYAEIARLQELEAGLGAASRPEGSP
ncbi:MAG TPA: ABC transporter ATP-binding protein [Rectinemataceae bacterium]|nr:ABC transporter ATP-binding protein [Rectinemataceae bacterium]